MSDNRTTEKYEGLIDSWKLRKLASTAQGYAECDPRLNGREILFESAEAMRKAANTIDALSAELGGRKCEIVGYYEASTRGEIGRERVKLSCGHIVERHSKYCQECGAKVREAVAR